MAKDTCAFTLEALRAAVAHRIDARIEAGRLLRGPASLTIDKHGAQLVLEAPPEPPQTFPSDIDAAALMHAADLLLFRAADAVSPRCPMVHFTEHLCSLGAARLAANQVRLGNLHIEVLSTGLRIQAFVPFDF